MLEVKLHFCRYHNHQKSLCSVHQQIVQKVFYFVLDIGLNSIVQNLPYEVHPFLGFLNVALVQMHRKVYLVQHQLLAPLILS